MASPALTSATATIPDSTSPSPISLRHPTSSSTSPSSTPTLSPPALSWLSGPWNVTHSTLPMWKKSRNVIITYTPIPGTATPGSSAGAPGGAHIDDQVSYQALDKSKSKISTVKGVDKPNITGPAAARDEAGEELASLGYKWRGKGWLAIASSQWEILGYGEEEGAENSWVVTYFASTLFTPAGVDFYSRRGQLRGETIAGIKKALAGLGGDVAKLADGVFEVAYDGEREGKA